MRPEWLWKCYFSQFNKIYRNNYVRVEEGCFFPDLLGKISYFPRLVWDQARKMAQKETHTLTYIHAHTHLHTYTDTHYKHTQVSSSYSSGRIWQVSHWVLFFIFSPPPNSQSNVFIKKALESPEKSPIVLLPSKNNGNVLAHFFSLRLLNIDQLV